MLLPSWILFAQVMVGIMITAPNYIEEKEHKTLDALRITPLTLREVIMAKCTSILLFSIVSQLLVYIVNMGVDTQLLRILPVAVVGGIIFIQVGMIIGLTMNSSKTATALSSIFMVLFFLIGTLYQELSEWKAILQFIPSVVVVENFYGIFNEQFLVFEVVMLLLWAVILYLIIFYLINKELKK